MPICPGNSAGHKAPCVYSAGISPSSFQSGFNQLFERSRNFEPSPFPLSNRLTAPFIRNHHEFRSHIAFRLRRIDGRQVRIDKGHLPVEVRIPVDLSIGARAEHEYVIDPLHPAHFITVQDRQLRTGVVEMNESVIAVDDGYRKIREGGEVRDQRFNGTSRPGIESFTSSVEPAKHLAGSGGIRLGLDGQSFTIHFMHQVGRVTRERDRPLAQGCRPSRNRTSPGSPCSDGYRRDLGRRA